MTPETAAAEVGAGIVTEGWGYVTAAYTLSWLTFIGYTLSLWLRQPKEDT